MLGLFWIALFWVTFLLPFHLFPFQDLPNNLVGMLLAAGLFFLTAVTVRGRELKVPIISFFLLAVLATVLISALGVGQFIYTDYTYAIFLLCGLLVAISVSNLGWDRDRMTESLARGLIWIAMLTAMYGLLRYYGLLQELLPWISADSPRLIGPLNQANLTALVLAIGIGSCCYSIVVGKLTPLSAFSASVFLAVAGSLTGSRAFVGFVLLILLVPAVKLFLFRATQNLSAGHVKITTGIVASVLMVIVLFPQIDEPLTATLTEMGLVDRTSSQAVADRFGFTDSYRAEEWKKLTVFRHVVENKFTGVGPGRYGHYSVQADALMNDPGRNETLWIHAHNLFVNFLVEMGYLGLLVSLVTVFYLVYVFIKEPADPKNLFVFTTLGMLFLNNMVEFSFWLFGFFALGISLFTICDRTFVVKPSSSAIVVFIGCLVFATSIGSFLYVSKDVWASINGFHKHQLTDEEHYRFLDAKKNRFVGGDAFKAQIIRERVSLFGVEAQIRELEKYMGWRPEMVFMMRYATLKSVVGPREEACQSVKQTVSLYPKSVERLVEELDEAKSLGATFDLSFIQGCVAEGMMYWIDRSRDPSPAQ